MKNICTVEGCAKPILARGICAMHYTRLMKTGDVHKVALRMERHGYAKTTTHNIWCNIKARTGNPKSADWPNYGGRGITMCERWRNSFVAFLEDMGECPKGHSIDRIDNDKGYEPGNCRWATRRQQNNNKRSNRLITHGGRTMNLSQWADYLKVNRKTLQSRVAYGWDDDRIIEVPIGPSNR